MQSDVYFLDKPILELRVRLKNTTTNSKPADNDNIGVVNNLLSSMLKSVDITLNDVKLTGHSKEYPYRAYLSGKDKDRLTQVISQSN